MTENRERRKVQLESLLGTPLGQLRLTETYRTTCGPPRGTWLSAVKPEVTRPLRNMIEAIVDVEYPPTTITQGGTDENAARTTEYPGIGSA